MSPIPPMNHPLYYHSSTTTVLQNVCHREKGIMFMLCSSVIAYKDHRPLRVLHVWHSNIWLWSGLVPVVRFATRVGKLGRRQLRVVASPLRNVVSIFGRRRLIEQRVSHRRGETAARRAWCRYVLAKNQTSNYLPPTSAHLAHTSNVTCTCTCYTYMYV